MGIFTSLFEMFENKPERPSVYKLADVYAHLREEAFKFDPKTIGVDANSDNKIYAVLMETGNDTAVVSLVTVADGAVSLYFSTGGGIIGLGEHAELRQVADDLISSAPEFLQYAKPDEEYPLPDPGQVRFSFLSIDGVFAAEHPEDDLGNNKLPLSPLFHKAQAVITQARIVDEKRKKV